MKLKNLTIKKKHHLAKKYFLTPFRTKKKLKQIFSFPGANSVNDTACRM